MKTKEVIAIVTGANRGIGFEICRQLVKRGAEIILTARSAKAGEEEKLAGQKVSPRFHPLDVTKEASVKALNDYVLRTFERVSPRPQGHSLVSSIHDHRQLFRRHSSR